MNTWQGQKIRLRASEPEDWEIHYEWNQDTDMPRNLYYIWFPESQAALKKGFAEGALKRPENDRFDMVIETLAGGFAGFIGAHTLEPRNGTFKYGLAVVPDQQRKGYASEAVNILLRHYFDELRYQKVTVHVFSFNEASIKLHERLGFQLEGRLRRMIYSGGQFHDELIYGMTDDEFRARYMS